MKHLRFGALLLMRGRRLGFYLSHRVVLTVPRPGPVRACALKHFRPAQVFCREGIAVPFFDALMQAATSQSRYSSSLEMAKKLLGMPEEYFLNDLLADLERHYGAVPEEFRAE